MILGVITIPYLYYTLKLYSLGRAERPEYPWPHLSELWKTVVSGLGFFLAKKAIVWLTIDWNRRICKDQNDPVALEKRADKASRYIFMILYFIFATSYGYYTFKDAPFLPWWLGGSGTWEAMFEGAPYVKNAPGAVTYAMLQLGYHGGDLVHHHFFAVRQNDYAEMMVHHIAASALLFCMIFSNFATIGCVVAF
jgi:hypothetical protein